MSTPDEYSHSDDEVEEVEEDEEDEVDEEELEDEVDEEDDEDSDGAETGSCTTFYSAVLQAPRIAAQYCPTCDMKASSRLCLKCRDSYICYYCAPRGVCHDCIITCVICAVDGLRGDFLTTVCESCESVIGELSGEIIDVEGLPHRNLIELINADVEGKIFMDEIISEEIREYLNAQGIHIEDACQNG